MFFFFFRYWKKEYFDALSILKEVCKEENIEVVDAAHRWLIHHSKMESKLGDKIIVGVSKLQHLKSNTNGFNGDVLPQRILDAFDVAAKKTQLTWACYFR